MNPSFNQKITGQTNELAKERNRAASERTMASWIQNCISLIGIGFGIEQIVTALDQKFPSSNPLITIKLAYLISLLLIAFGIILLITVIIQNYLHTSYIRRDDYFFRPSNRLNLFVSFSVIIFGLLGILIIFLGIQS